MNEQIPIYPWFDKVPEGYLTRNQLEERGMRPGGPVRARVVWQKGRRSANLYALSEAKPKQAATPAQIAALEKAQRARRTCPACKTEFPYVLGSWDDCPVCTELERDEERKAAARTAAWWLADPNAVVLDTETTSLDGFVVEVAVVDMQGKTLLNKLVYPQVRIEQGAQAVHGITDEDLLNAPTFADIYEELTALLSGRKVITYNVVFDLNILGNELQRLGIWGDLYLNWQKRADWRCAMELYAQYVGEWSERHGAYRWIPLGGGHRALGDCLACLERVKEMAAYAADKE